MKYLPFLLSGLLAPFSRRMRLRHLIERCCLTAAANEGEGGDLINVANASDSATVFQIQQDGRFFVPYGRYKHPKGEQLFNRESAQIMASVLSSMSRAENGFITTPGVPLYKGHPDVPGRADSDPSAPAHGWITGIVAENGGAFFNTELNTDGENAIRNKRFRFYSPNWNCRQVKGGIQPVQLLSIGLTNHPRIPVPAIANDSTQNENMQLTPELLKLLGFAENDTPTDEQIIAAVQAHNDRVTALIAAENDLATNTAALAAAQADLATARAEVTAANDLASTAQAELASANAQIVAANDRVTTLRKSLVREVTGRLVETLRLPIREQDKMLRDLEAIENDAALETRIVELVKAPPLLKTHSVTGNLGKEKSDIVAANDEAGRRAQRTEAIDEERFAIENDSTKNGLSPTDKYNLAFKRATAKHPTLFPTTPAKA